MSYLKAMILGLVQGLTEFLPVSSSGHLAIFERLLNINMETGLLFDVMLHFGTLLAIFVVYFKDIKELFVEGVGLVKDFLINICLAGGGLFGKKVRLRKIITTPYRKFVLLILIGSVPAGVIGIYLENYMENLTSLLFVGCALLVTSGLLYLSDRLPIGQKTEEKTTYSNAFVIGIFQAAAILPGISRSGSTIVGGLLHGLKRSFAIKFSFILSIPAVLGATLLQAIKLGDTNYGMEVLGPYLVGTLVSAVVGYICIKTLIVMLNNNKLHYFSYYCLGAGILTIIASFFL